MSATDRPIIGGALGALTTLQISILRACSGEAVSLPYDREQGAATRELIQAGLIYSAMEDDQPTCFATLRGRMLLSEWRATP